MTCPACAHHASHPASGSYAMQCLSCCTRLVASARPLRRAQEALLAAIARQPGAPARAAILQAMKEGIK